MVTPTSYLKLHNESLSLQIQARDLDGSDDAIRYTLDTITPGVMMTSHGQLTWLAEANANITIAVNVIDSCDVITDVLLSLYIIDCPCEGAQSYCTPRDAEGQGRYDCACFDGYTGDDCAQNVDECASQPCQHGGTCVDGVAAYTCRCAPGFTGVHCATDVNECESSPCVT